MKKVFIIPSLVLIASILASISYFATYKNKSPAHCSCEKMTKTAALLASFNQAPAKGMVWIPEGTFMMGGHDAAAKKDEYPQHQVKVSGFYMDETEVTNAQFAAFVKQTHYVTTAEQSIDWELLKTELPPGTPKPAPEKLAPGSMVFTPPDHVVDLNDFSQWWRWVSGANWLHPLGPDSKIFGKDHPVVQVSWFDAKAYCTWAGKRLPTEAEREWAASGGLQNKMYPWGDEDINIGKLKANTWQGNFPDKNTKRDGYYWTAPVKAFPTNAFGLYDMAGNVWEWTADLYDANYYTDAKKISVNPQGPEKSFDPEEPNVKKYVLKGGSFLCNKSYCLGYRVSARMKTTPDSALVNTGFRCVK